MSRKIIFTGGGTAGHVYPGLSVVESLKERDKDIEVLWIGAASGMEKDIVEDAGIRFIGVPSGKLRRYFSLKNFTDLFKITAGFIKAFFIIGKFRPDLVFSKGGFVSVPPVAAAGLRRIAVFSHESDVSPGLATRLNKRWSEKIFVSYKKTLKYFPGGRAELTGNPVRKAIYTADPQRGRALIGAGGKKIIMVMGGSLGALQINQLIEELVPELCPNYVVVHQTGKHSYEGEAPEGYKRYEYIGRELPDMLAASDLVISRAGASAIWEIAALGKASILIPLGTGASRGDQLLNAEIFRSSGASVVLEGRVEADDLNKEIERIMNNDKLRNDMAKSALNIANGNPADLIADKILKRLN